MPTDDEPAPVTLPGYAVADLLDYLDRAVDGALELDRDGRCDVLFEMAGYLRSALRRGLRGGAS